MSDATVTLFPAAPAPGTVGIREGLVALKGTLARVQADLEADAHVIDGKPFTSETIAEALGTHLAMTGVLAKLTEQLVDFVALLSSSVDLVQRDATEGVRLAERAQVKAQQAWEATP